MKDVNILTSNGVNIQKSLELFGDMETYDDTLKDFLSEIDDKMAKIKMFKERGDMANYAILVHSLKSDARYFGFEKLQELAYNHELESKSNNLYYVTDHYEELIAEANKIINAVKVYMGVSTGVAPVVQPQQPVQAVQQAPVTNIQIKDKTILVVDDSNVVRNFVAKIFNNEYEVVIANDGGEALNIIKANTEDKIEAMLLDLNMPNVDGFQVLDYFKENNLFTKIQ